MQTIRSMTAILAAATLMACASTPELPLARRTIRPSPAMRPRRRPG